MKEKERWNQGYTQGAVESFFVGFIPNSKATEKVVVFIQTFSQNEHVLNGKKCSYLISLHQFLWTETVPRLNNS